MPENRGITPALEEDPGCDRSRSGNSVTVTLEDTLGALFLGILSTIALIGWMRAEARCRALSSELAKAHGEVAAHSGR